MCKPQQILKAKSSVSILYMQISNINKRREEPVKHIYHHVRGLTDRQQKILVLRYERGYTNYKIARDFLKVDPASVAESHNSAILKIDESFATCQTAIKLGLTPQRVSNMVAQISKNKMGKNRMAKRKVWSQEEETALLQVIDPDSAEAIAAQ